MDIRFGTGGWRAVIGDGFTKANVQILAAALARKMKREGAAEKGVVIGYDRRFLSDVAAVWAAETLAAEGVPSAMIDREAPTPLVMFAVKQGGYPYGMAITASHNPAVYNGVKVFTAGGRDAEESVTDDIVREAEGVEKVSALPLSEARARGLSRVIQPLNDYIDSILSALDAETIKRAHLKVALDPMFGVSKTSLQTILMTARCDVDVIHERRDALFGGRLPAPNHKTLSALSDYVTEHGMDIGIATDGDADRLGVIDDRGRFLHPNEILVLLYYYLLKYKGWKGAAVRNLATTHLLDAVAADAGEKCYEVPVGFKYVSAKMEQTDAVIGGESSGGLTVRGHIRGKDGIYAGALLIEMMAATGRSLSEIYREITDRYGTFCTAEHDYRFGAADRARVTRLLLEDKKLPLFSRSVERVSYEDGCKVFFRDGWLLARFSGTEPLIRIFAEAVDEGTAEADCARMREFLGL